MAAAAMAERGRVLPSAAPAPGLGTEGLPRAFLQSLRTLFDILDDRRRGYVHLCEIESRWQGADARELPHGVLEGLRQAAPASGYLTFERFVAGLRFSLLSAESGPRGPARAPAQAGGPGARPAEKLLPQQRLLFAPADEPRTVLEKKALLPGARPPPSGPCCAARSLERLCGPREAALGPAEPERSPSVDSGAGACRAMEVDTGDTRRASRVRGEHRRHTITNGVDCDLLKQLRELEQEKEVLLQGLEMMARGRDWYQQQLQRVQERQRRLGQSRAGTDLGAEGSPRSLGQLLPKVQEVARCLGELLAAACAGKGSAPPEHPNRAFPWLSSGPPGPSALAPASTSAPAWLRQTILMLKEQNRLLTKVRHGEGAEWGQGLAGPDPHHCPPGGDGQERAYHATGAGEIGSHQAAVRGSSPQPAGGRTPRLHLHLRGCQNGDGPLAWHLPQTGTPLGPISGPGPPVTWT
ncbi:suppressor APC domain-containing protein 2 isoform X1 [Elephas maximus indicus]|uniref:suppressor APC domain-containing protein 2 isoform X1 n=1 Tax=Elephas maximus indicus TaxID=99487 RepID=UPI0021166A40|nr:suppressor APC domain-containing protein 2 isoform X1 [Elephas maximus indicus]